MRILETNSILMLKRRKLKNIHIISDEEYNKSATLDIESLLIEHVVVDEIYVQNGNKGISGHNYYDREKYLAKFEKDYLGKFETERSC